MGRKANQLSRVVDEFRQWGVVDAHKMLVVHGITRLADYVYDLRRLFGWKIETKSAAGQMAVYRLMNADAVDWAAPFKREGRKALACATCGTPPANRKELTRVSPTFLRGTCAHCGKTRMFR